MEQNFPNSIHIFYQIHSLIASNKYKAKAKHLKHPKHMKHPKSGLLNQNQAHFSSKSKLMMLHYTHIKFHHPNSKTFNAKIPTSPQTTQGQKGEKSGNILSIIEMEIKATESITLLY